MPTPNRALVGQAVPVAAIIFCTSARCPVPDGYVGYWFDGKSLFKRNARGTDSEIADATVSYAPARLLATSLAAATYAPATKTITANAVGALTVDSVAAALGDRVVRKLGDVEDGIFVVADAGKSNPSGRPWKLTRADDLDDTSHFTGGAVIAITAGTSYANTLWELSLPSPFAMDTEIPVFTQTAAPTTFAAVKAALAAAFTAIDFNGQKLTGIADPTDAQHAATRNFVVTLALGGDLGGTPGAATVDKIGGKALPSNVAHGFLKRNAANDGWEQVAFGSASDTVCQGNDARLSDSRAPSGSAGGDLSGSFPNPSVANAAITAAKAAVFFSAEQTGTGAEQSIAHGLAATPSKVALLPTAGHDGSGAAGDKMPSLAQGTHTGTNVKATVSQGAKFTVIAWA